jgi:hypothetical protein
MKLRLAVCSLGVVVLLFSFSRGLLGAAAPRPPSSDSAPSMLAGLQTYHIELNTLSGCRIESFENCAGQLSQSNIAVSSNGRSYPVRVITADQVKRENASVFPTHLLVVFPRGRPRPSDAYILKKLKRALARGWLVSVTRSDGSLTPYSTGAALAGELAAASSAHIPGRQADTALAQALETLKTFAGRRLLVVDVAKTHDKHPPAWVSLLAKTFGAIYLVDGGVRRQVYYDESWGSSGGTSPAGGEFLYKRVRFFQGGVSHEVKLGSAIKDMLKDGSYDYDIQFVLPDTQSNSSSLITLTLHNSLAKVPYQASTDLYSVAVRTVDGKPLAIRAAPSQKLLVREE